MATQPVRPTRRAGLVSNLFGFQFASRDDPLANVKSVRIWAGDLPPNDPVGAVEAVAGLLEGAGMTPDDVTQNRLLAVLELDRLAAPLHAQLRAQCRMAAMSHDVRQRLWQGADDLAHGFAQVYEAIIEGIRLRGDDARARAELHGVFARMFFHVGMQSRQGLFRYEQWIPGRWRLLHGAYRGACEQGVAAEPYALDAPAPVEQPLSPEQEYLQILLLQRINTGNLTAQQIDQAADWMRGWAHLLRLAMTGTRAGADLYWLDLGRGDGLATRQPARPVGEVLCLDVAPLHEQLAVLRARLTVQAGLHQGASEAAEQLALVLRLQQLWQPQAPEQVRRGERLPAQCTVSVALGWSGIAEALAAKIARRTTVPPGYHYDDYGRLRPNADGTRGAAGGRADGPVAWHLHDTSDSGVRLCSTAREAARQRPGALLALRPDDEAGWQLGIVRRIRKLDAQQTELGIEIISREPVLVSAREAGNRDYGASAGDADLPPRGKSFGVLYLPPQRRSGAWVPPALVLPPDEYATGRPLLFIGDGHPVHVCLPAPQERTREWVWAPIDTLH